MRACASILLVCIAACSRPERVFVPGPSYSESIEARSELGDSATVRIGQPLTLHVQRRSGPWVEVDRSSLRPEACWLRSAPPALEEEVAANVRWLVDPTDGFEFNTDFRPDLTREVRFTEPGIYLLTPESSGWCSDRSVGNPLHVEVTAR